ncbi:hypothetical protein EVAR_80367_1 [Eumeta japonica]|uniref:Uncharacterized protein n=1 Tax=Eumeta variegata TaxID=151549 RepID=A0A4C1X0C8_EUMVA|nr:hypothetical protein EVAR_80367_1 [Eumeta japonica]
MRRPCDTRAKSHGKRVKYKWGGPRCFQSRRGRAAWRARNANAMQRAHNARRDPDERGSRRRVSYQINKHELVVGTVRFPG